MKLVTEISRIKKLSKEKEEENWGFRSFLKSCGIPTNRIDSITQKLYKKVSEKIDCRDCSNCCKEILPILSENDIEQCTKGLNISAAEFKKKYLEKTDDGRNTFNKTPCPFLRESRCSIYEFRPSNCRSYPYIGQKGLLSRLISVIHNCSVCPIVFNVYEYLKSEIWAMDGDEDSDDWEEFI